MKDNFLLKLSQSKIFYELSDEDAGKLIKGIFKYCEKNESELEGYLKIIFIPIKDEIDKNEEAYKKRCEKNRENGLKGGAPKGNKNASKQEITQNNRTVDKTTQNNPKQHDNNHLSYIINHNINKNITYYSNNELNQIFIEYLELRKQLKAKNTERAINSLIKKLSNYDDETKILMIDKSIRNSWKDVYELKEDEVKRKASEQQEHKLEELTKDYTKNDSNLGELEELLKGF